MAESHAAPENPPTPTSAMTSTMRRSGSRLAALRDRTSAIDLRLLATAFVLALITWPTPDFELYSGLDPAWRAALQMAVHDGLDFGRDVVFTYGPLGFLGEPLFAFPWLARLSFAYIAIVQFALCLTLLWALRRNLRSLPLAVPVAFLVVELSSQEPVPVIVFAIAVGLVRGDFPPRLVPWVLAAIGGLAGVQALSKLNIGTIVLALCAIALLTLPSRRPRAAAWFASGLVATLVAGWLLTGQPVATVWGYARGSLEILSGYSEAMRLDEPTRTWELWAALALAVIGFVIALRGDPLSPRRMRIALAALWAVLAFTAFKEGFVRHHLSHTAIFFAAMLGGLAVLPLARLPRATAGLVLLLPAMALFGARGGGPGDYVAPERQARTFFRQAGILADTRTTNERVVAGRERLAGVYGLDPQSLAKLRGHTVHVDPNEANAAFAYGLVWKPLPVFQTYSAYTSYLDELNAGMLASQQGPQRVLRHAGSAIDGRNAGWESPAAMRAMLCNFRAISTTGQWQVLARAPDRCGISRLLGETRAGFGESVAIPPAPDAHTAVYAVLDGVAVTGVERLVNLLYRAEQRVLTLDGKRPYRLVARTAADGLLLRVPRDVDFPQPFGLDQGAERLAVTRGTGVQPGGAIGVRWYAVALRRAPTPASAPRAASAARHGGERAARGPSP